jgi:hypothetical protein
MTEHRKNGSFAFSTSITQQVLDPDLLKTYMMHRAAHMSILSAHMSVLSAHIHNHSYGNPKRNWCVLIS